MTQSPPHSNHTLGKSAPSMGTGSVATLGCGRTRPRSWPLHDPARMERDFLIWRRLRESQAQLMRPIRRMLSPFASSSRTSGEMTAYGVPMRANWQDGSYANCHYGTYGPYLADIIRSIECPFAFLDVGANQGLFTLIAAGHSSCKLAIAIEPVAATFDKLEENIALNDAQDKAVLLECALSNETGVKLLTRRRYRSGVATFADEVSSPQRSTITQPVQVRRMEQLCAYLPKGLPIFVKVDVSGHDAIVIEEILTSSCSDRIIGLYYEEDESRCDKARLEQALNAMHFVKVRRFGRNGRHDVLAVPAHF